MTNKLMNMDEIADRYFDLEMATDEIFTDMVNRWDEFTETDRKLICKALAEQMNEYALYKILDGLSYDLDVADMEKDLSKNLAKEAAKAATKAAPAEKRNEDDDDFEFIDLDL